MATKLKKMKLTSVDLVRAGANQKADICLYKSANVENCVENPEEINNFRQMGAENSYNIDKAGNVDQTGKEGMTMIKIDKSRFTPEELEKYNELIAKASVDPGAGEDEMEEMKPPMPQKKKRPVPPQFRRDEEEDYEDDGDFDDMDKGCKTRKSAEDVDHMQELFKSAFERQNERIAELEKSLAMKEFTGIAKKFAALGENEDELAKTLYDMHEADESLYNSYVASLEKSLDLVEKSGIFAEIGKSGAIGGPSTAVGKVQAIAKSYTEKDPTLTYEQAIAKAWENNPELIAEYEAEYRA